MNLVWCITNLDKKKLKLYNFECENYIKFVSIKVKSFYFREEKKGMMKDASR